MALDVVDLSCNLIGDRGLATLADVLLEEPPSVLKLFNNRISDARPMEQMISRGCLREIHLSNNRLPMDVAIRLVVAAAAARDDHGNYYSH